MKPIYIGEGIWAQLEVKPEDKIRFKYSSWKELVEAAFSIKEYETSKTRKL